LNFNLDSVAVFGTLSVFAHSFPMFPAESALAFGPLGPLGPIRLFPIRAFNFERILNGRAARRLNSVNFAPDKGFLGTLSTRALSRVNDRPEFVFNQPTLEAGLGFAHDFVATRVHIGVVANLAVSAHGTNVIRTGQLQFAATAIRTQTESIAITIRRNRPDPPFGIFNLDESLHCAIFATVGAKALNSGERELAVGTAATKEQTGFGTGSTLRTELREAGANCSAQIDAVDLLKSLLESIAR
jgi:hypothetical protein